jgi:8-oxo-dGTP diphosphatase
MTAAPAPRIGVAVIVVRDGRVLVGQRLGAHGAGQWALPGGHLEFGEDIEQCARRELAEETGLQAQAFAPGPFTNNVLADKGLHYVTLFMLARHAIGEPQRLEPDKCAGWHWLPWSALPSPLFGPLASLHQSGFIPEGAT